MEILNNDSLSKNFLGGFNDAGTDRITGNRPETLAIHLLQKHSLR